MSTIWSTAVDFLDRTAIILTYGYVPAIIGVIVAVLVLRWLWMWLRPSKKAVGESSSVVPVDLGKLTSSTTGGGDGGKAVYMVRESARHVADAIENQKNNPLSSYYHAVHANVLASVAKDMTDDTSKLSNSLGVDIYDFLSYTQQVVSETEHRLSRRRN
jgi:hypothetical protein